jgi:hypothetical protein
LLEQLADATSSLGPVVNPLAKPVLLALVNAVATSLEGGDALAQVGVDQSFTSYAATVLRGLATALGISS